jgi:hypothetical protein
MLRVSTDPAGAAIIRSKKDSRLQLQMEKNLSASAYLSASDSQYRDEIMARPGFGVVLNDPLMARIDSGKDLSGSEHHRFSTPFSRSL